MPSYHEFDPWRQAAQTIAQGMIARNSANNRRMLAEQEMAQRQPLLEAQTETQRALAGRYNADTRKTNLDADLTERKLKAAVRVSDAWGQAYQDFRAGTPDTPAMRTVSAALVDLNDGDTVKATKSLQTLLTMAESSKGNARAAGIWESPASVANQDTRSSEPVNLPDNTSLVDPKTGSVISRGFSRLSAGQQLFAPGATNMSLSDKPVASVPGNPVRPWTPAEKRITLEVLKDDLADVRADIKILENRTKDPQKRAKNTALQALYKKRDALLAKLGYDESLLTPSPGGVNPPPTSGTNTVVRRYNPTTRRLE
jgi:hypothetical protein